MLQPPSHQHTMPPSHPGGYRHLGTGSVDRSVRVQMIIALVAGLVMIAVPLYLWRRPKAEAATERDVKKAATTQEAGGKQLTQLSGAATSGSAEPARELSPPEQASTGRETTLGEPKMVKCSKAGGGKTSPEQCDHQPWFEESLVKAIRDNASCAAVDPKGGTINFVLDVDHKAKKVKVWAGKSGTIKKKGRKEAVGCVARSMPTPDWSQLPHQYQKYQIAVMATYPASESADAPSKKRSRDDR